MEHTLRTPSPAASSHIPITILDSSKSRNVNTRESTKETQLRQDLRHWAIQETGDWDLQVEASRTETICDTTNSDLWDSMPTLDSKAVARSSPIFERYLGRPLDIRLIRAGGYQDIDHMLDHIVPAMMLKVS